MKKGRQDSPPEHLKAGDAPIAWFAWGIPFFIMEKTEMSMFEELYALAVESTLTMQMSADEKTGRMTIHVIPKPKKETDEAALSRPLSLTALPAEFDAGFVTALKDFRQARQSLAEQAEATLEVLAAAKNTQTKKAGDAVAKATRPAPSTAQPASPSTPPAPAQKEEQGTPAAAVGVSSDIDLFGQA
jgi:PRTRC genetic system protein E